MGYRTNSPKGSPAWVSAGGASLLFVGLSLGLHGVLLGLPVPLTSPPDSPVPPEPPESAPLINVVDLPPSPAPEPDPDPIPAPATKPNPEPEPFPETETGPAPIPVPEPDPDPEPEPEPIPEPPPNPPDVDPHLDYNRYVPNGQGKTTDELAWLSLDVVEMLSAQYPNARVASEYKVTLPLIYPLPTCLPQPPSPGRLLAVVQADGTLDRSPRWVAGTGYDLLDEQALEQARAYRVDPPPGVLAIYSLEVEIDYDPETCTPPEQL